MRPLGATPTTHILKLPMDDATHGGIDMSTSVENEFLCSRILAAFGIPVAPCEMATFEDQRVLVVERFDRTMSSNGKWIVRRPQEDFCQVFGKPQARKYENEGGPGIIEIVQALAGSAAARADRIDFLRTQFVFWLLCAIDGHAKNFSVFIEPAGRFRLTPRYDVLSAYPFIGHGANRLPTQKIKMAMGLHGTNKHYHWSKIRLGHFIATAQRCGMGTEMPPVFDELLARAAQVADEVAATLPKGFPDAVGAPILDGLRRAAKNAREGVALA